MRLRRPYPVIRLIITLILAVGFGTLAACSGGERPVLDGEVSADLIEPEFDPAAEQSSGAAAGETATSSTQPESVVLDQDLRGEQIAPAPDGVLAVITTTGVLVPVIGKTPTRYQVIAPCGDQAFVGWGHEVSAVQVVLDPGHGGSESGADDVPDLTEAELNLQIARRSASRLLEREITVAVTRTDDYRIPIQQRAAIADQLQAEVFVSIHHNTPASKSSTTPGTEVYVQSESDDSARLGGLVYEEVFDALSQFDVEWTSRDDAGVLVVLDDEGNDAYGIVRRPMVTSALVELAYLGNPDEAALLATDEYVEAASTAVADGIERFLTTSEPGSGFIETPRVFNPSGLTGGVGDCVNPRLE